MTIHVPLPAASPAQSPQIPYLELQDKVVIVTGGSRGVGEGIADVFARCGARLLIAATDPLRNQEKVDQLRADKVAAAACDIDISREEDAQRMVETALSEFGRIDILVNNAGLDPRARWDQITAEDWDRVQEVNSKGYYLAAKYAAPAMVKQGWGRIVNISSSVVWLGNPDALHYVVSKGANVAFTRSLALALKKTGVTVNCVAPGAVQTEKELHLGPPEYCDSVLKTIVANQLTDGRLQPEDIGWLVAYLCTDAARFINGQTINIDGGRAFH
jgi:3-oxoacyl-[acyl-carrier protein] reductase